MADRPHPPALIAWALALKPVRAFLLYREHRGPMLADSITYRTLFSVFAGVLLGFSLAALWLADNPDGVARRWSMRWMPPSRASLGEDGLIDPDDDPGARRLHRRQHPLARRSRRRRDRRDRIAAHRAARPRATRCTTTCSGLGDAAQPRCSRSASARLRSPPPLVTVLRHGRHRRRHRVARPRPRRRPSSAIGAPRRLDHRRLRPRHRCVIARAVPRALRTAGRRARALWSGALLGGDRPHRAAAAVGAVRRRCVVAIRCSRRSRRSSPCCCGSTSRRR